MCDSSPLSLPLTDGVRAMVERWQAELAMAASHIEHCYSMEAPCERVLAVVAGNLRALNLTLAGLLAADDAQHAKNLH